MNSGAQSGSELVISKIHTLPTDIQWKIASYLDIDSRRVLGVYNKVIPELYLKFDELYKRIPKIRKASWGGSTVILSNDSKPLYLISKHSEGYTEIIYVNYTNRQVYIYGSERDSGGGLGDAYNYSLEINGCIINTLVSCNEQYSLTGVSTF